MLYICSLRRTILTFIPITVLFGFLLLQVPNHHPQDLTASVYYYFNPGRSIACFRYPGNKETLPEISSFKIRPDKSIFFHETSCRASRPALSARQACAVESAALHNPNLDIYITFSTSGIFSKDPAAKVNQLVEALKFYKNIHLVHINFARYTNGTQLEHVYTSGKLEFSQFATSHASDILRYLTLYKYGGIYMDLDTVVLKSLEDLPMNFAGAESKNNVAAGVLSLSSKGKGHEYASECLKDLETNYQSHDWGSNGPGVITRLLRTLCGAEKSEEMVHKDCGAFKVYPQHAFYPIEWPNWAAYFAKDNLGQIMKVFKDTYVAHVWNKHSSQTRIAVGVDTPYTIMARENCPRVFAQCDDYF